MPRRRHVRAPFVFLALSASLAVPVGCSHDGGAGGDSASTAPKTAPAEKPEPRRQGEKAGGKARRGKEGRAVESPVSKAELEKERRATRREAARDRAEDRKLDRSFAETPFEKIVSGLPIREPPLFVEQYITSKGSSTVYTAVAPKRFFCGRSPARRKAAVSAFYREADKLFRRGDVDDFVQVVTPIAVTTEELPALAVARNGSVALTKRGRAKGPC